MSHGPAQAPSPMPTATDGLVDVFEREHEEHLDADVLEAALQSLVSTFPDAPMCAFRDDGVMVAMPDSVALQRNRVLEARSGLDLIVTDEAALGGWDRLVRPGAAQRAGE